MLVGFIHSRNYLLTPLPAFKKNNRNKNFTCKKEDSRNKYPTFFRDGEFKHAITSPFNPRAMDPEVLKRRLEEIKRQMLDVVDETWVEGGGEGTSGTGKRRCHE